METGINAVKGFHEILGLETLFTIHAVAEGRHQIVQLP
jgi:hypothetical protein